MVKRQRENREWVSKWVSEREWRGMRKVRGMRSESNRAKSDEAERVREAQCAFGHSVNEKWRQRREKIIQKESAVCS